ncbi:MAG: hypothetical protein Q4B60_06375 [Erysipelotrichaceae bacterium]|nr:hypothetical protein [Erysipelotrichaceae bacterium]
MGALYSTVLVFFLIGLLGQLFIQAKTVNKKLLNVLTLIGAGLLLALGLWYLLSAKDNVTLAMISLLTIFLAVYMVGVMLARILYFFKKK